MATQFVFNGRIVKIPGSYTETKSGVTNPPLDFSYGRIVVIDNDPNNVFGGGSGVGGELVNAKKAIYEFDNNTSLQSFIRGGVLYDLANPLFKPNGADSLGISRLFYIRALDTIGATLNITWAGGGANGGTLTLKSRHEGLCGNGVEGNEIKAQGDVEITAIGALNDTIIITANSIALGTYTSPGSGSTIDAANSYAAVINANTYSGLGHGYSAIAIGNIVRVFAPDNAGAAANAYTFTVAVTGTATAVAATATMGGGVDGDTLTRGLCMTMELGTVDTSKFKVKFWRGTFTGLDEYGVVIAGEAESITQPQLLAESPEFNNMSTIIEWMNKNSAFNNNIKLMTSNVLGDGSIDSADLIATAGNQLFSGGTQSYSAIKMTEALSAIRTLDFSHILSLDFGSDYASADNGKIWNHINGEAKYEKHLWIAGGHDRDEFESITIAAANFYNDQRVLVVHGGIFENAPSSSTGLREKSALKKAAYTLGRTCGLAPQTPLTFKALGYAGEVHELEVPEIEQGLDNGVLMTNFDSEIGSFIVIMGINSLQLNNFVINDDGKSHLLSINRIKAQLNKELEINIKRQLLGNQTQGPNIATLNKEVVKNYGENYLKRKTATATQDNLIISYENVTASQNQDAMFLQYGFKANVEINKVFTTSVILDPNI